jgi:hypothetical protein
MPKTIEQMMLRLQRTESGCLEWMGARTPQGYGHMYLDGVHWYAHRLMYSIYVGPIGDKVDIHHKCENPPCADPEHLEALTRPEHAAEHPLYGAAATHAAAEVCAFGHEFDGHDGRQRTCSICRRRISNDWSRKHRAELKRQKEAAHG